MITRTLPTGFVQVSSSPNIQIFYSVDGPINDSKPVILLSSSLAANTHLWDDFTHHFKSKYTIIRYDARFHGQSPLSSDTVDYAVGHTMEELAEDVLKILDHLQIKRIRALIGLSIGAAVGLIFGAKHPHRVDKVVVVGTRASSNAESNANHATRITYGYEHGPRALGRQSIARWFDADWASANPKRIAHAEDVYCSQTIQGYEASIAALRRLDLFPYAEDIGTRSDGGRFVFVAGALDGTVPKESSELAALAGSEVIVVQGSGHITPVQMPETFHEVIENILAVKM